MNIRLPPSVATVAAALASGVLLGQMMELGASLFGSGPFAAGAAVGAGVIGLAASRPMGRGKWLGMGVGAIGLWRAEDCAAAVARLVPPEALPGAGLVLAAALAWAISLPFADALARVRRRHALLVAIGVLCAGALGREAALLFVLVNGLVMARAWEPLHRLRDRARPGGAWRAGVAAMLVASAWGWVAVARPALDPTFTSWQACVAALLLGIGFGFGWIAAVIGLVGAAGGVALVLRTPAVASPLDGAALLALSALGVGMLAGAAAPGRGARWIAPLVIAAVSLGLPRLPDAALRHLARGDATVPEDARAALADTRARLPEAWVGAGVGGIALLHGREGELLLELDGVARSTDRRLGTTEAMAGLLAGCGAEGRNRAVVARDELGLGIAALRDQGFLLVDGAAPLPAERRALATLLPLARRAWLHPSVRLNPLPPEALALTARGADALVELVTTPWPGPGGGLPDRRHLALVRRQLAPGGAYVLALPVTHLADTALRRVLHDVGSTFPSTSLWLTPESIDAVLVVGRESPMPWSAVARCRSADPIRTTRMRLAADLDLAALAHAGGSALRALSSEPSPPGVPPELRGPARLPAAFLLSLPGDGHDAFAADAPADDLAVRADARRAWIRLVAEAGAGNAAGPAPARAMDPVVGPLLQKARAALEVARKEGLLSKSWQAAEAAAKAAAALSPGSAPAQCLLGTLDAERGQWSPALEAFTTCATLDPTSIAAWDGVASVRQAQGDLAGAEEALRKVATIAPQRWQSQHNLGLLLSRTGRYDQAESVLKRGAALAAQAGDDASPHLALADLYLKTDRAPLALVEAEKAMGLRPDADAWYFHGAASWQLGHTDGAERDFREALTADPRHILARGGLGLAQARRGDYEAAALSFQAVLAADPQNAAARDNLATILPRVNPELLKATRPPP